MRTILAISTVLVVGTVVYSLNRFGITLAGFLRGDGGAILEASTALIGIWALVIGFSFAAIEQHLNFLNCPLLGRFQF